MAKLMGGDMQDRQTSPATMENTENKKTEWLLGQLSSFGRFVAIDWLQDLDAGRRLTPFPSPYHKTGELWVNDDDMLEVLVVPYTGPDAEEHVNSADHTVQTGSQGRVWQVVPGLPQWARFLRGNTPPDWPHVYGVGKRAREEQKEDEIAIQARPRKRTKLSRRRTARKKTVFQAEEERDANAILSTLTDAELEEALKLVDSKEQQANPQSQVTSAEMELEEALQAEAMSPLSDGDLEGTFRCHRGGSLELGDSDEYTAIAARATSPGTVSPPRSSEDDASTTSSLFFVSPSPSPSLSDSPSAISSNSSSDSPSDLPSDSPSASSSGSPPGSPSPSPSLSPLSPGTGTPTPSSFFFLSTSPSPMRSSTSLKAEEDLTIPSPVSTQSTSPPRMSSPSPHPVQGNTTTPSSSLYLSP